MTTYQLRRAPVALPRGELAEARDGDWLFVLGLLAHAPLALAIRESVVLGRLHMLAVLLVGLWFVARDREPYRVVCVAGYVAGAEVLWRMTNSAVFWESGKYLVALLLGLALLKWRLRLRPVPVFYFALLLPSAVYTLFAFEAEEARQQVSFNLSGPFTLALAAVVLSQTRLDSPRLLRLLQVTLLPIVGIAFLAATGIMNAPNLRFGDESNFAASGGFGPNQVSGVLGLGALLAWIYALLERRRSPLPWIALGLVAWLTAQAALTFSRGGLYSLGIAAVAATPFLAVGSRRTGRTALLALALAAAVYVGLPRLDEFTGGALQARLSDTGTTNRLELAMGDLGVWLENPVYGVGPGVAPSYRASLVGIKAAGHTEFTRLLSEHGALGLAALALLGVMAARAFFAAKSPAQRGLVLAFALWGLVEMGHSAMRIAAISYVFALSQMPFQETP